nr:MAG TPA: Myoactive tetradecapeptides family [Caudoviricetes sp.]
MHKISCYDTIFITYMRGDYFGRLYKGFRSGSADRGL